MEVDELMMKGEVLKEKRELKGAEEGKATKEMIMHKGGRETGKTEPAEKEKRRLMEEYAKWKREKDAARPPSDPEKWNDYYVYQARSFEKWWTEIYSWAHGSFNNESE
ncbi:hypothetical protein BAE44_0011738 [Dichanthelium oligosanthes]|uniref:Uncharacterized protein n=1 Tax=Dichanthelium oligosanthes TaxID=888268 RepID=A0A1E5VQ80_9POAL|nr:hypothetical protein BAE44_0011738 [Dichanthelium oligosanthes]